MGVTLDELANHLGATLRGDGSRQIARCEALDRAAGDGVSFVANPRYVGRLATTQAGAVIVHEDDAARAPDHVNLLICDDPYFAFREVMVLLHGVPELPGGVSDRAFVDPTATIGDRCTIMPGAFVGAGAVVGDDCVLHPNVVIYHGCVIGDRVTLQAGCVIGQDGFGYATHGGEHHKIPPIGSVVIEDDVEMGAACTVDRATMGETRIGRGTKFSNAVTIGHGSQVGRFNLFVAQVGLAGSVTTGDYVVIGGQAGVAGHLTIGDRARIAAGAGVAGDVPAGIDVGGAPAVELSKAKRAALGMHRLPNVMQRLREIERRLKERE